MHRRWSRATCAIRLTALALTVVAAAACTSTTTGQAQGQRFPAATSGLPTQTPNGADTKAADTAARAAFEGLAGRASALYVGIWDPRRGMFTKAYGHAVRGGAEATVQDSLRIASITKTFTATVVLQLVAEDRIKLDADLADHLPELVTKHPPLGWVTVRQLLAMRSGLPDYIQNANGIAADIKADPARVWRPAELVAVAMQGEVAEPGTVGYSNTNFVLLQLVAERVTKQPLRTLIEQRITGPLELRQTALPRDDATALPEPAAHGYFNQACVDRGKEVGAPGLTAGTDTTDWNTSYMQGAGGMVSTLDDLGRWAATTTGTELLPAEMADARLAARDIGIGGVDYGLGIARYGSWYGHDGEALGWQSLAVHNPATGVSFVAAVNACSGMLDDLLGLLRTLYPD